jgi:TonB family protein
MLVYGLRLLVALITFAVGATASWLLGSGNPACRAFRTDANKQIYVVKMQKELPPPPAMYGPTHCDLRAKWAGDEAALVEGGILNGKAHSLPAPLYPTAARAARVRGSVPVRVVVDVNGRVTSAEAYGGPQLLREAAEDAALEASFAPTRLSGRPVKVSGTLNYNFSLQ